MKCGYFKAPDCKIIPIWALYLKVYEFNGQLKTCLHHVIIWFECVYRVRVILNYGPIL